MKKYFLLFSLFNSLICNAQQIPLKAVPIHLQKGLDFTLRIPKEFNISVAAEGLSRLRFLCKSPDGRLFATDMKDLTDNQKGKIYIFEDWNNSTKKFQKITTYLEGLRNPNQIAFYSYQGFSFIYIAETHQLSFYPYFAGDKKPSGTPKVIATFPDYGLSYKYGGWHLTRSLAIRHHKIYVSVGSSCNTCIEKEEVRATIMEMNMDGSNKQYFAKGVRNAVDINWVNDKLYGTNMGCDLLPDGKPDDTFVEFKKDKHYGWPYYYQYNLKMYAIDSLLDVARKNKIKPTVGIGAFKAHSAPLGFEYFKNFNNPWLKNSFLVCLHGSTTVSRGVGYSIVKWIKGKNYVHVVDGFLQGKTEKDRFGRPCDIMMNDENSFFFTDDFNGVLYFVYQ